MISFTRQINLVSSAATLLYWKAKPEELIIECFLQLMHRLDPVPQYDVGVPLMDAAIAILLAALMGSCIICCTGQPDRTLPWTMKSASKQIMGPRNAGTKAWASRKAATPMRKAAEHRQLAGGQPSQHIASAAEISRDNRGDD